MTVIADRYELHDLLGHGGMARVYVADDRVLQRRVAVKLLRDDIGRDEVLRERFLREARLAAGLNHPNVIRVYDAGVDDETPWIAMELVEGPSLREEMSRQGPYPADDAVALISQVLAALGAAHAAGVVHRDIKPANILLGPDGPKLGDFGIAKSLEGGADLTQTNQFMGTPKYTAPEVAVGLPATPRADVYSTGVLLWEMLAARPPYDHANPLSLAMMHRTDPLPSLAAERPDLPGGLVAAVEAGLAKEPADRPADAATFAAMLSAGAAGTSPAALTATAVIPLAPAPSAPPPPIPREPTAVMPRPQSPPPVRTPRARPAPARPRKGGFGVAVVVVGLLMLAAYLVTQAVDDEPTTLPTDPPTTPVVTPPAPPPTTPAPVAPIEPAPPPPPPAPPPAPAEPTVEPTIDPPPPPPPPTDPPPEPEPEPEPEPTGTDAQLLPVPGLGD